MLVVAILVSFADRPIDGLKPREQHFNDAPYCGIYSVYAAASSLGVKEAFKPLVSEKYVPSVHGSSAQDLVAAFAELGVKAEVLVDAAAETLRQLDAPAVLHLRHPGRGATYQHWVAYLGVENGQARIMDTINALQTIPFAELLAHWDGVAIVPAVARNHWAVASLATASLWLVWPAAIALLLIASTRLRLPRVRAELNAGTVLVVIAGTLAAVHSFADSLGMRRNAGAVGAVVAHDFAPDLAPVAKSEVSSSLNDPRVVIVDARGNDAYKRSHVPGAVNLPIGAGLSDRIEFSRLLPVDARIIVYCQSEGCSWADAIAADLYWRGHRDIGVYRGGVNEWAAQK